MAFNIYLMFLFVGVFAYVFGMKHIVALGTDDSSLNDEARSLMKERNKFWFMVVYWLYFAVIAGVDGVLTQARWPQEHDIEYPGIMFAVSLGIVLFFTVLAGLSTGKALGVQRRLAIAWSRSTNEQP